MKEFVKKLTTGVLALFVFAFFAGGVLAASGYSLFGGATHVTPGNSSTRAVELTSNTANAIGTDDFSGISFETPDTMTFAGLTKLATDYMFTDNSCGGGSPRFQVNLDTPDGDKNAFVYIGPSPNYTGCPTGVWTSTGDLVEGANFVDTSQLSGGAFYDTFTDAVNKYGSYSVTGIQLVTDAGWAFASGIQTVQVDNVMINDKTYTFEPKAQDVCKDNKWKNFTTTPGPFKNQGQCVSHFMRNATSSPSPTITP